ncbi:hypothetical protein [Kitasatospora viridis]|uniref:Uncharacterized protein n=1 Tax=Kitasatospora viridis TaxID=281105 RepID=A0A561TSQ2_9ACTN|nr:hypothetical protein [Kitasatospora viridis]TWF90145.1 hypothetical protein FHX73_13189 [Kitasatospora viridis]
MTSTATGPTQESAPQTAEPSPEGSPSCSWPDCTSGRESAKATTTDGNPTGSSTDGPDGGGKPMPECHPGLC